MLQALAVIALLLVAACGDDPHNCAEVYADACRSAYSGRCGRLESFDTEERCIDGLTEKPRPGDETYTDGVDDIYGMFGCRFMHPETDLARCHQLTANRTCSTAEEEIAFVDDWLVYCVANWGDWREPPPE